MGSSRHYPEEAPVGPVAVEGFWMDETPVTNAEFDRFVQETGYMTTAEKAPDPAMYPGADPALLVPGSITFDKPPGPVDLNDPMSWWAWTPGADWRHPWGPRSDLSGREDHPVTQVTYEDADTYARWADKTLPTEAQWERAARGGLDGAEFAWGDDLAPGGEERMNRWIGEFPWKYRPRPGGPRKPGTVPVRSFPENPYGLFGMTGNAWEWTDTWFSAKHGEPTTKCCAPLNPRGPGAEASRDPASGIPRKVLKGGSFLCAENYCSRYRPAARIPETVESSTCHVSFRCIIE
jgi:sulfatase modifying factor 1